MMSLQESPFDSSGALKEQSSQSVSLRPLASSFDADSPQLRRRSRIHGTTFCYDVWSWTVLLIFSLSYAPLSTYASPIVEIRGVQSSMPSNSHMSFAPFLLPRDRFVISNASGTPTVIDPSTLSFVAQGSGSDGGGQGFNAPALIWIAFSLAIGIPMALAGVHGLRGWRVGGAEKVTLRLTTGVGVGLAGTLAAWAAIINSISASPISDLVLTLIVLCFFIFPSIFGCFSYGRLAGVACLGLTGGLAFGIRIVILRPGLLIPGDGGYGSNWGIISLFGIAGGLAMIWGRSQRWGLLFGCASVGSFLAILGTDLIINKQTGMSRGLRFLFDRNGAHFLAIEGAGYTPSATTQILIGISLTATPALALFQNYFFKQDFWGRTDDSESFIDSDSKSEFGNSSPMVNMKLPRTKPTMVPAPRNLTYGNSEIGVPIGSVFRAGPANLKKPRPIPGMTYF